MFNYILRRLLTLPVVILGVTLLIFLMMQMLSPYQLLASYIRSPEELKNKDPDALIKTYGLDRPAGERYIKWLKNIVKGDLGWSNSANMSVAEAIKARFPATLELALYAVIPVVFGGILLGSFAAMHHNRIGDHLTRIFSIIGWSLPSFVGGLFVLMIFYGVLGWFPPGRLSTWAYQIVYSDQFIRYTGMHTIDALLNGNLKIFWDAVRHLIGPVLTLSYLWWAFIMRITRSSMLDILNKDYVRTGRSKGLPESVVIKKYIRKNALIPVITVGGLMILGLLGGVVIVETVFDFKGIGLLTATAAQQLDYAAVLGTTMFYCFLLVIVNLVVDILYAVIDPRVRLE